MLIYKNCMPYKTKKKQFHKISGQICQIINKPTDDMFNQKLHLNLTVKLSTLNLSFALKIYSTYNTVSIAIIMLCSTKRKISNLENCENGMLYNPRNSSIRKFGQNCNAQDTEIRLHLEVNLMYFVYTERNFDGTA